jgi:uncharacterized RDD family membrane protein YckC
MVVPSAVELIPVDEVLNEIDFDHLMARIDLNAVLARVDIDALLKEVDIDALISRVDVDDVVQRIDVDRLMERLNIAEIIKRAQVDAIVSATAGGLGKRFLDLVRRQLVGMDIILTRIVDRVLHRQVPEPAFEDNSVTGQISGGATRLGAFFADLLLVSVAYTLGLAIGSFMASLFVGHDVNVQAQHEGIWYIIGIVAVATIYQWSCLIIAGRTIGHALAGLRVTAPDGSPIGPAATTRRVLVYPFSFVLGLGLIGIVTGRRHRALHDMAAPSLVRYDWGDRSASMPAPLTHYLERAGVKVRA